MPLFIVAAIKHCLLTTAAVLLNLGRLVFLAARSHRALAAENLFLRKQLALFLERKVKPRRADDADRWLMATLSRMFPWRDTLLNVKPDTLIRWRRKGFRLFWLEVEPNGEAAFALQHSAANPRDGRRESDLGRRAHRRRVATETRDSGLAPHRREVPAKGQTGTHTRSKAALADLRP